MKVVRNQDIEYHQLKSKKTGEEFSRSGVLSAALASKDFFIHHEILGPGKRASAPHFHKQTEEFLYVLSGSLIAVEGTQEIELAAGDSILFSADSNCVHFVENRSQTDVEMLVISKKLSAPDVHYD